MDKKILKILQEIQREKRKMTSINCENNITEVKTNDFEKYQAYENSISIILSTMLKDTPIPYPEQEEIEPEKTHFALFEYGSYKVDIFHDNKNYIAEFDGVKYSCNKLADLKKDLQIAIVNKGIDKGEVIDHDEILRNSSL